MAKEEGDRGLSFLHFLSAQTERIFLNSSCYAFGSPIKGVDLLYFVVGRMGGRGVHEA